MIDRFEKFSFAISELHRYLNKITADEMERYGLKGPHAIYLFVLYRYDEGITESELSELCFKNKADVSRVIGSFEKKGLIVKKGGTKNNYRAQIMLTEDGIKAANALQERAHVLIDRVGSGITDENRNILYETLGLIASNMRDMVD